MLNVIVTGGLGAGKTNLINRIRAGGTYLVGSPATTMKVSLAKCIARTYNIDGSDHGWEHYFNDMMDRREKEKYRGILQGYGEHFSNLDNFFWINRTMHDIVNRAADLHFEGKQLDGTLYDSIRRPSEIIGIRETYPDAAHVHLKISGERQMGYLINHLGYNYEKAVATLAHSSEHWLDDMVGTDYDADIEIDADFGDGYVWNTFKGFVEGGKDG